MSSALFGSTSYRTVLHQSDQHLWCVGWQRSRVAKFDFMFGEEGNDCVDPLGLTTQGLSNEMRHS